LFLLIAFHRESATCQSGIEKVKFSRITSSYGLSNSNVRCILQDSQGFLWVGTEDGLNRFDGYGFKIYRKSEGDSTGLIKNSINTLLEDSHGTLWVATRGGGLHHYDRRLDRFIRITQFSFNCDIVGMLEDSNKHVWIAGTRQGKAFTARFDHQTKTWKHFNLFDSVEPICSIVQESENEYWIGVIRTGFFKWNSLTNTVESFLPDKQKPNSIIGKDIRRVIKDNQGNLWIAATEGLSKFEVTNRKFINFTASQGNAMVVDPIRDIASDKKYIWLATENGGLSRVNKSTLEFTNFLFDKNDPHSLSDNSVWSVYVDHEDRIWVGTFSKGLCVIDDLNEKFSELNVELKNDVVNAIFEDSKNRIWIGTEGGLVVKDKNRVRYYEHDVHKKGSLSRNPVLSIFEDHRGQLWFGTWDGGLNKFDEQGDRFINYSTEKENPLSLSNPHVYSIKEYSRTHQLLVSSYRGLNVLKGERRGQFERHIDEHHESNNYLRTIYEDSRGNLWLGSIAELYLYSLESRKRTRFNLGSDSISFDFFINCITEDQLGNLWVGTNNGLFELTDKKKNASYTVRDGLPSNIICGILEDRNGNLWLSSTQGISLLNPRTKTIVNNFTIDDGLLSNEFKPNSCLKSKSGLFFFGGNGVNVFNPEKIKLNSHIPPIYFTDLKIFNRSMRIGENDSILRVQISETKKITLPEKLNFFSIEFVALNFSSSNKNQYAYKLEGFDKDWVRIGSQRSATFTNLSEGTYTFHVRASNNDGLWNEKGIILVIQIQPTWWKTGWAKSLAVLMLTIAAISVYAIRVRRMQQQNLKLEKSVAERTMELQAANEELRAREDEIKAQNDELFTQREELATQNEALVESKKEQLDLYTQSILEKSEIIYRITAELELAKSKPLVEQEQIEKFNQILQINILTDDDWEHFKKAFTGVYPNFFGSLRFHFLDITASELRLSALIKLNLSSKEAANTLGISSESVKKSRYRLKKKFMLKEDESLEEFIRKLI